MMFLTRFNSVPDQAISSLNLRQPDCVSYLLAGQGTMMMPAVWVQPTITEWYMMLAIGFFASAGHLLLILSLRYADASKDAKWLIIERLCP